MRRGVAVFVVVLTACGDPAVHEDAGVGSDAAPDGTPPIVVDAGVDAPSDAPPDAPPRCGDNHVDPGEQCDGIEGLSGDGCSAACTPEAIEWTNLTPNSTPTRAHTAVAYDSARGRVVLFGGFDQSGDSNETWEYDGTTWTRRLTLASPPAQYGHVMVYDSARQRVILFGRGQTWELDGVTWVQRTPATSPPDITFPYMAYDPARQVTVLWDWFLENVWEWDGTNWTMKTAVGPGCCSDGYRQMVYGGAAGIMLIGPSAVSFWDGTSWTDQPFPADVPWSDDPFTAVYDPIAGRPLAIGHRESPLNGLSIWQWTNNDWIELQPTVFGSPYTGYRVAAFDEARNIVVLYTVGFGPERPGDTWEWNGSYWRHRYESAVPPRGQPAFAYDARRGRVVMFGDALLDDTWEWDGVTWHARTPARKPPARAGASATYDERRGRVVIHGGFTWLYDQAGQATFTRYTDTWEWDGFNWRHVVTPIAPASTAAMTFDRAHGYVLALDGDTWTFDGSTWTKVATAQPITGDIEYDARRGVVVLVTQNSSAQLREWNGSDWIAVGPAPNGGSLFYDRLRARVVLHDGYDFWAWDGTAWSDVLDTHSPLEPSALFAPNTGAWFSFGSSTGWDTWLATSGTRDTCNGPDSDGDGLARCADPDCWWRCTPLCAPGEAHCDPFAPHCGDGVCSALEANVCPADCP